MFVDADGKEQKVSDDVPDEMYEDMLHSMAKLRDEFNRHSNVTNPGPTAPSSIFTKEAARALYAEGGLETLKRGMPAGLKLEDVLEEADIGVKIPPPGLLQPDAWYTMPMPKRKVFIVDVGKFEPGDLKKINKTANMFFWPGFPSGIEPLPDIEVDLPEFNMAAQWKKDGLCPECGSKGEWINMAAVCKDHGKFMG